MISNQFIIKILSLLDKYLLLWVCPPYHDKGECDVNGTVIKKKA
jgi:hypothetical protein